MRITDIEGKEVKIGKNSITCKGENGKTAGVVTGITPFLTMQANKQFLFSKKLRISGVWGSKFDLMKNVVCYENKLYLIASIRRIENMREYDFDRYAELANIIEAAEQNDIKVLLCYC